MLAPVTTSPSTRFDRAADREAGVGSIGLQGGLAGLVDQLFVVHEVRPYALRPRGSDGRSDAVAKRSYLSPLLALAGCAAPRQRRRRPARSRRRRSKCRSSRSTISTAISRRRRRRGHRGRRHQAQDRQWRRGASGRRAGRRRESGIPNTVTVSAGDLIGASPLISAQLPRRADHHGDEPRSGSSSLRSAIMNSTRARDELLRMQDGGCEKFTSRQPCAVEPFAGAQLPLSRRQRVRRRTAQTLFPATGIKTSAAGRAHHHRLHRHDAEGHRHDRHAVRRGGLRFADEADDRQCAGARR